ncbi:MAG: glycosyltransferase family 2 protein, partial [Desulfovibrio sp.]|nr:glycosyltransferase family 2 protein [Desulfovibrio sp.]
MQAKDNPPKTSLIIPVYNQWRFTKACLEALAETIGEEDCEIIVVDNGSSDETVSDCALLGNALFSARFRYKRLNTNCNFGPASNIGAKLARGEFLLFLNNDTAPQNSWLSPLLDDFSTFPNLGATGPLLLYPETEPFGHSIQHLGVTVTPYLSVSHLYEGIPAKSPLAQKRRFFQIITAACMLIPKRTFMDAGMFDEHYINGVEDIDLCAHLFAKNLRMTVNPKALVIHHTSQTPGREKHEAENYAYFQTHCQPLLSQDMDFQVEQDGMELRLNPWLVFYPHCKQEIEQKLDLLAAKLPEEKIAELLIHEP